jgi:cholesterol transport system auxiliary component
MKPSRLPRRARRLAALLTVLAACGCAALKPVAPPQPAFYLLTDADRPPAPQAVPGGPVLTIDLPSAAAGYDSPHIIYLRAGGRLEYFAHSDWVDPPSRMLAPLLASAMARTGMFGAVLRAPHAAAADLRLDSDILRLQQQFDTRPSRVRLTLRATLIDERTRRVLMWREFDIAVDAAADTPEGGAAAANLAVRQALDRLAAAVVPAVAAWRAEAQAGAPVRAGARPGAPATP